MYVYVYVCAHMCIYIYIYIYVCALYVYVCIHIYVCMTHMCVYVYMYVYIYVYICIYLYYTSRLACLLACLLPVCLSCLLLLRECTRLALCDLYNIFIVAESATITESADLSFHDIPARRRIFPSLLLLVCPRTGRVHAFLQQV